MNKRQVEQVRRFNRIVTQHVGALQDSYLQRGRPLGQARLLHEVGSDGIDVRVLRGRLKLDSGYLSRLLRSLEAQGLVQTDAHGNDGGMGVVFRPRQSRELLESLVVVGALLFYVASGPGSWSRASLRG
jgi:DNA-binding MarR family transcriptional regulator